MPSCCLSHKTKPHQTWLLEGRVSSLVSLIWHWELLDLGQGCLSLARAPVSRLTSLLSSGHAGFHFSGSLSLSLGLLVEQNDVEATKAAPVMNSAKADSTASTVSAPGSMDEQDLKKVLEKCKRQQTEINKLAEENRQLKVRCVDEWYSVSVDHDVEQEARRENELVNPQQTVWWSYMFQSSDSVIIHGWSDK